jgi:3,4-dihydroxy 2-butanone 4-phosphate synthase/GTP cyclohydrolase II
MNDDGTMARLPDLVILAERFDIKLISIKDLITYRLKTDSIIEKGEQVKLPTAYGSFDFIPFRQISNGLEHAALVKGTWTPDEAVLVRIHSSCFTGDIFGSLRCDCGPQLHRAMEMVEKEGRGAVIYLSQEGRGIGLLNKIRTYKLQEQGRDTVEANLELGFAEDERDYGVGASILRELGLGKIRLISNNPVKRAGLEGYGITIIENIPLEPEHNQHNEFYLETKANKMGHKISCYKIK